MAFATSHVTCGFTSSRPSGDASPRSAPISVETGNAGDEIGSRVIAGRMVGNIMRLAMPVERRYAPYPKWFGAAFARLPCAPELRETLEQILSAPD
ncbi:MAG: DUF4037 domain-containing protein [Mesorhizobium sp.]|nr:MAG: DUF4037 domain-containing protein [Mesorhizobium sp.]RWO03472.1 MAG: DUF4037 domain-containing protein [Mesorhizobium sp.]